MRIIDLFKLFNFFGDKLFKYNMKIDLFIERDDFNYNYSIFDHNLFGCVSNLKLLEKDYEV